jgi:serine/threonine protein kinase
MSSSTIADFEILEQLGKGSFGVVYKVRRKGKEQKTATLKMAAAA